MTIIILGSAGLLALVIGAEMLVRGASKLALRLGISPLVVGLTVVAFGTSSPELAVSTGAALNGQTDIAVGNVVGSNIFNVLFILGAAAVILPIAVHQQVIRQEVPVMIGASVLLVVLSFDGELGVFDCAFLFALLVAYTVFLSYQARAERISEPNEFTAEYQSAKTGAWDARLPVQLALIAVGLVFLAIGAEALVSSAVTLARMFGISELIIGLTIVAAGTSLPEVAASIGASLKGERDIAVGNVIGSNVFNILGVLGFAGLAGTFSGIGGFTVPASLLQFDLWVMLAVAVACLPIFLTGRVIARWEGALFLAYYAAYTAYLILAAQRHEATEAFSDAMLGFVIPITLVTLVVTLVRRKSQ